MSRRSDVVVPPIVLDAAAPVAIYLQLARQLADAIREGALEGARLPATRTLASLLGISRNTVLAAYDELVARGLIEARRGSGTRVPAALELVGGLHLCRCCGMRNIPRARSRSSTWTARRSTSRTERRPGPVSATRSGGRAAMFGFRRKHQDCAAVHRVGLADQRRLSCPRTPSADVRS